MALNYGSKTCGRCGETKLVTEFGHHAISRDRLQPWCSKCKRDAEAERWVMLKPLSSSVAPDEDEVTTITTDARALAAVLFDKHNLGRDFTRWGYQYRPKYEKASILRDVLELFGIDEDEQRIRSAAGFIRA